MGRGKGRYNKDCERVRQEKKKEKKRKIRKPNSNTTKRKVNW